MIHWIEFATPQVCNFKCVYCYNREPYRHNSLLSKKTVSDIIDDIGPKFVSFLGGEPSLYHSTMLKYLKVCQERGIETRVATNTAHLTTKMIRQMKKSGLTRIWASYNCPRELFNKFRRPCHEEDFDNIRKIITFSNKIGLTIECDAVLTKYNYKYLPQLYEEASKMGATTYTLQTLIPNGSGSNPHLLLTKKQYVEAVTSVYPFVNDKTKLLIQCNWMAPRCTEFGERIYNSPTTPKTIKDVVECMEGFKRVHVHNNGDVLLCDIVDFPILGNIYKESLSSILEGNKFYKEVLAQPPMCRGCVHWERCHNVCRGMVYMETRDLNVRCADLSWTKIKGHFGRYPRK